MKQLRTQSLKIEIATVQENKLIASNIWEMKMTAPGIAEQYKGAGQFIQILVQSSWDSPLRRPMSIAAVDGDQIAIIYKVFGGMTRILTELKPGSSLDILGPLGNTFTWGNDEFTSVLVGGGVGLAPILNMYGEGIVSGQDSVLVLSLIHI